MAAREEQVMKIIRRGRYSYHRLCAIFAAARVCGSVNEGD